MHLLYDFKNFTNFQLSLGAWRWSLDSHVWTLTIFL